MSHHRSSLSTFRDESPEETAETGFLKIECGASRGRCHSEGDIISYNPSSPPTETSNSFRYVPASLRITSVPPNENKFRNKFASTYQSFDEIALADDEEENHHGRQLQQQPIFGSIGGDSGFVSESVTSLASMTLNHHHPLDYGLHYFVDPRLRNGGTLSNLPLINHQSLNGVKRDHWKRSWDFLVACLCYSLSLNNIIEFPLLALKNGGGAFILAYCALLILLGLPFAVVQAALGQYVQRGVLHLWKIVPMVRAIATTIISITFIFLIIRSTTVSYTLLYFLGSFLKELPWEMCNGDWNAREDCDRLLGKFEETCLAEIQKCPSDPMKSTAAALFWNNFVLGGADLGFSIHRWEIVVCLCMSWSLVLFVTARGPRTVSKFSYIATSCGLVLLLSVVLRVSLQPSLEHDAIIQNLRPKWEALLNLETWNLAGGFLMRGLFPVLGVYSVLGSRNKFMASVQLDTSLAALANGIVTIASCCAIFAFFAINPSMKERFATELDYVSFAFVVPTQVFGDMALTRIWCIFFYGALFLFEVGTVVMATEALVTSLEDYLEEKMMMRLSGGRRRLLLASSLCAICFLFSLMTTSNRALPFFYAINYYIQGFPSYALAFIMIMTVMWVYGFRNFDGKICTSMTKCDGKFFYPSWLILIPLGLLFLIILNIIFQRKQPPSPMMMINNPWMDVIGISLHTFVVLQVPLYASYKVVRSILQEAPFSKLVNPPDDWGPVKVPKIRIEGTMLFSKKNNNFIHDKNEDIQLNPLSLY